MLHDWCLFFPLIVGPGVIHKSRSHSYVHLQVQPVAINAHDLFLFTSEAQACVVLVQGLRVEGKGESPASGGGGGKWFPSYTELAQACRGHEVWEV